MRLSLFLIASAAFAASSTVAAEPIKVPLFRRHNDDSGIVHADAERLDNGVLGGKVHIGTPPQEFTFAFDTSTGYSWVRGSRCKSENCLDRCTYYARRSETAVSTGKVFKVKYGNSCVDTKVYLDTFEFGGLTVTDMPFGGAYRMSGFDHGFDGYLGLGRSVNFNKSSAYTSSARTSLQRRDDLPASAFVTNAYQQGTGVESAQFGMYTTSTSSSGFDSSGAVDTTTTTTTAVTNATATTTDVVASATTTTASAAEATSTEITSGGFGFVKRTNKNEPAGYLVIGGVDKSVIDGDIYYFDVVDNDESESSSWDVPITKVKFGNELAIEQRPKAVASFSTSEYYIAMPADQADIYHEYFGGKVLHSTGTYKVKCSKIKDMPPLKLELGDYVVQIPAKYWTRVIDADSDCCATRIRRGESYRDWVLGTTFTNLFYTTFDPVNEKVGIALVKGHENDGIKVYKKD